MGELPQPLHGSTWSERDSLLVEYYSLKGEHPGFIARAVDRTPRAVEAEILRIRRGIYRERKRLILQPRVCGKNARAA